MKGVLVRMVVPKSFSRNTRLLFGSAALATGLFFAAMSALVGTHPQGITYAQDACSQESFPGEAYADLQTESPTFTGDYWLMPVGLRCTVDDPRNAAPPFEWFVFSWQSTTFMLVSIGIAIIGAVLLLQRERPVPAPVVPYWLRPKDPD